jgi:hypothetical protein
MPLVGGTSSVTLYFTISTNKYAMRLPLRSESINPKYGAVNKSEALLGQRAPAGVFVGKLAYEGNIEFELHDLTGQTGSPPTTTYKHMLLAVALWGVLGSYNSTTQSVSLNTSTAPKFDYIKVTHGNSSVIYQDVYVTNLSIRVNSDGIPTATMDVRAKSTTTTDPTGYTDLMASKSFGNVYNATHFKVKVGSTEITSKVASIEITIPQNIIDYYTLGSLNARDMAASSLEVADVKIEYYPDAVTSIDLATDLNTAFTNGTASTSDVIIEISSPSLANTTATLTLGKPFVTEFTHDINGPEYITSNLSLQVSPANISLTGVLIG